MWKNAIRTQMFNANICIVCDVVKKVERSSVMDQMKD